MTHFHIIRILFCLTSLLQVTFFIQAIVTIEESGMQYESYPANNFGRTFDYGSEYEARLQVIVQDEYLCGEGVNNSSHQPLFVIPKDDTPGKRRIKS